MTALPQRRPAGAGPEPVPAPTILLLDLDGTVLVGDAPVLAYARGISIEVEARVAAFLADPDAAIAADPVLADAQDGYQATARISRSLGLSRKQTQPAFLASRAELAGPGVSVPPGLSDLLASLASYRVIVTNSPVIGIPEALIRLGLGEHIDGIITDAHKPDGMKRHVNQLLDNHGLHHTPQHLMSVGDIWRNDLAFAYERGCVTAYVDRFARHQGPAHLRAADLPSLYDSIRQWASDPIGFVDGLA